MLVFVPPPGNEMPTAGFRAQVAEVDNMLDEIRSLVSEVLHLGDRGALLTRESRLLGEVPEFDSMAVVALITTIEEHYDIEFDDEELTAESFATLGSLCKMVESKVNIE